MNLFAAAKPNSAWTTSSPRSPTRRADAIINVGTATETEVKEKKMRAIDSKKATRWAAGNEVENSDWLCAPPVFAREASGEQGSARFSE